jgi:hypothetical protein
VVISGKWRIAIFNMVKKKMKDYTEKIIIFFVGAILGLGSFLIGFSIFYIQPIFGIFSCGYGLLVLGICLRLLYSYSKPTNDMNNMEKKENEIN